MNFDFNKKDTTVENNDKVFEKKKTKMSTPTVPKIININFSFDKAPQGFWAVMIAAVTILSMGAHVEDAGWGLLLAFLMLEKRKGFLTFALAALGLAGMYSHIEGAGFLLFFAFLV